PRFRRLLRPLRVGRPTPLPGPRPLRHPRPLRRFPRRPSPWTLRRAADRSRRSPDLWSPPRSRAARTRCRARRRRPRSRRGPGPADAEAARPPPTLLPALAAPPAGPTTAMSEPQFREEVARRLAVEVQKLEAKPAGAAARAASEEAPTPAAPVPAAEPTAL